MEKKEKPGMTSIGSISEFGPVVLLPIDKIEPSPFQVRRDYGDIDTLAESIRAKGLLQPILVRPKGDRYEIVHGHRRFLACQKIGKKFIESFIKDLSDEETIAIQGAENIQRHDYSPIEEAIFYKNYKDFLEKKLGRKVSLREIASSLNVDHTTVERKLGLLDLPNDIQEKVHRGEITFGKARELTLLTREMGEEKVIGEELPRTDRYYAEIRRLSEEIIKGEKVPLEGLKTPEGVQHAAQRIREGVPFEEALKEAQMVEAIEATKKEAMKEIDPRKIILEVRAAQPNPEEMRKAIAEANIKILRKLLEKGSLICPYCGGKDLIWKCTGKPVGEDDEKGS